MDPTQLMTGLKPLIVGFLLQERQENPDQTDEQLVDEILGDLKHSFRRKGGFIVDVLWAMPDWTNPLIKEIRETIASAPPRENK